MTNYTFTPSELPVGSIVLTETIQVRQISSSDLSLLEKDAGLFNDNYEPILLTNYVMRRLEQFKEEGNWFVFENAYNDFNISIEREEAFIVCGISDPISIPYPEYLHLLQMAIRSLTNKDLIIK